MKDLLPEVQIIEPSIITDERGLMRVDEFRALNPPYQPLQVNTVRTFKKGTLRGLHYQEAPYEQAKYIFCLSGAVLSVAVDIRRKSQTFGKYQSAVLDKADYPAMLIPRGFAHGYLTLSDDCLVQYYVDNDFSPEHAKSIRYDDPDIGIDWKMDKYGIQAPILSEKDRCGRSLRSLQPII